MPDYEDSRFSSTGHYPQSYAYTSSAFASGSRMTPNLDPPMQGVKRPDPIRQVSGSGTSNLRVHHHESQSFVSQQSLDSLQVVSPAEARETYIPPYTSYLDLTPLPFLPHSFPSAQDLDVERNSPYYEQGDHEVVIEKDQGEFRPSAMSRGASNASGKAGRWRDAVFPSSVPCRLLLLTVILESIVDLTIEGNILWRFNVEVSSSGSTQLELENKRRLPIYLIIFGLAHLWQLVLTVIAIRARNTVQVIAVTAFNFAFLGYAVIEIFELRQILGDNLADSLNTVTPTNNTLLSLPLNVLTAVVIAVVAVCCLVLLVIAYFLRREFGWERYRFLGADLQIRKVYFRFQVFECICYFSAFFCAGFGIQFIWLVLQSTDVEYIITWVAFPLSIILLIIGRFAAKYENRPAMGGFMIGLLAGCSYFIFKLVRIWQQQYTTFTSLTKSLTTFDALSLVSLLACLISGGIVWSDFGKGLKEAVSSQPGASSLPSVVGFWRTGSGGSHTVESEMSMAQRRISID